MTDVGKVRIVCTDRQTHPPRTLRSAIYHGGTFTWKEAAVDVTAAATWKGEAGHVARSRFRCPTCRRDVTILDSTLAARVDAITAVTGRRKRLDLDVSLLV